MTNLRTGQGVHLAKLIRFITAREEMTRAREDRERALTRLLQAEIALREAREAMTVRERDAANAAFVEIEPS